MKNFLILLSLLIFATSAFSEIKEIHKGDCTAGNQDEISSGVVSEDSTDQDDVESGTIVQ